MAEKKKVTVTTETKKPTGLSITRSGEKFTISWKIGDKNYKDGQQVYWRTNQTKKGKWFKLTCGTTTTSKAVELDFDNYIPHTKKLLSKIRFKIRGNREEYKTETSKQETTHKCTWSDYAEKEFDIYKPKRPKVSATLSEEYANRCSFHWIAANPSKDHRPFERVQWQSRLLKDSKITKGKNAFKKSTKGVAGEYKSGTGGASGTEVIIEDSSRVNGATPYTRWFRARSRGPGGSSKWVYTKHVYSKSNQASNVEVSTWKKNNGYLVSVKWTTSRNAAKPINSIAVQYGIGTPGAGMTTPAGLSWNDVLTLKPKDGTDKAVFTVDEFLENDQVLFVRINTQHDGVTTPGNAVIARVGVLSTPTLTNVVPVEQTHRATITATNESEVPGSFLAVTYKTAAEPDAIFIGIIEPGETQTVVQAPDWGTGEKSFGVRAFVGQYTAQTRSDGVTIYTITAYDGKKRMSSDPVWDNGAVPPAPTGVAAVPTETPGTVRVSWNNPWTAADGVELSWADHADAWESTEPPESYTVSSAYAAAWNIVGLEVGKTWFIRVRLIAGDASDPTPGPWSEIISQNLASAPNIPVLTLSEAIIAADGTVTASWGFASSDGTAQAYAEICEATINETTGVITYGDPKWTTLTAQHIDINAAEAEWTTGETYNLCVRVQSASGEFSDGWSAPVPITIAEPISAEITQTSLVTETIEENPREFAGEIVTFENTSEAGVATSLIADIDAEQDLNGYENPWPGGGGKNKYPNAFNGIYTGITYEAMDNGKVHASGTVTAASWQNLANTFTLAECGLNIGDTVTISSGIRAIAQFKDAGNTVLASCDSRGVRTVTIPEDTVSVYCILYAKVAVGVVGETIDEELWAQLEIGTSITSFEPYENICPITGKTDCDVTQTGTNIYDEDNLITLANAVKQSDGTYYLANLNNIYQKTIWANEIYYTGQITVTFIRKQVASGTSLRFKVYYTDGTNSVVGNASQSADVSTTYTLTSAAGKIVDNIVADYGSNIGTYFNVQIQFGTTATEYVPYAGVTYTTDLGQTVYGGTLDIISGELTVTHAMVDMGSLPWIASGDASNLFVASVSGKKNGNTNIMSDMYNVQAVAFTSMTHGGMRGYSTNNNVYCKNTDYSDAATFKTAMNGVQLVCELATPTTTTLTAQQVELLLGENNIWADTGDVSVRVVDSSRNVTSLKDMPLTITVTGAGETGETTVAIERAESYYLDRPDERDFTGHEGETIALFSQTGEAQITIENGDLIGTLDDGAQYRIVADVSDGIGQTAREELEFEVHWSHQAVEPTATVEIDNENLIAKITPIAPADAEEGDTCDIYRLSVDRPELIFEGAEFGTMYVDPYPALGEMGGHRIVFRTANGDYITEANTIAWADYTQEETGGVETMFNIIDFDGNQVRLMYDITIDAGWEKDFQQTKYLGGHIQGDWNAAVSRTGSVGGSLIVTQDQETIQNLRRLADYPGICHVRTRDGSSYAADVQVSEARDMGRDVIRSEFTLSITRVDPEGFDGLTYADWLAGTPNE